jgi:hypothetical protein
MNSLDNINFGKCYYHENDLRLFVANKLDEIIKFLSLFPYQQKGIGLLSGNTGISLLLFYYSRYRECMNIEDIAMNFLEDSVNSIDKYFLHTYCNGISGLCWGIHHLCNYKFIPSDNLEVLEAFDNFLCQSALHELQMNNNDFLHGGIGTLIYLLKRIHISSVKISIEKAIHILDQTKHNENNACYWNYYDPTKNKYEKNISLSHGQASLLIFLSKVYNLGIAKEQTKKLAQMCVNYILSQELSEIDKYSFFPNKIKEESSDFSSRLAWCYGDLGIAMALWHYSKAFNNLILEKKR